MGVRKWLWTVVLAHALGCGSKWDFQDVDGDGVSAAEGDCWDKQEGPAGTGLSGDDIHPDATETWYDGFDQNCAKDDDFDADADGFVPVEFIGEETRGQPESGLLPGGDCWDEAQGPEAVEYGGAEIHPEATDIWYDGVDQDCGGNDDHDADGDGYVPSAYADVPTAALEGSGTLASGDCWDDPSLTPDTMLVATGSRADDVAVDWDQPQAAQVYPGADDTWYDGVDQNCDGASDFDQDADGYLTAHYPNQSGVLAGDDCVDSLDDVDALVDDDVLDDLEDYFGPVEDDNDNPAKPEWINPGVDENWYDGLDADCGYNDDCDADDDGYPYEWGYWADDGSCLEDPTQPCCDLEGSIDCDDEDVERKPDPDTEEEFFNGVDDNCDLSDGDGDEDGDGFWAEDYEQRVLDETGEEPEETPPAGFVGDCDDRNSNIHPTAADIPYDAIDTDCLGNDDFDQDGDGYYCPPEICPYAEGVEEYTASYPSLDTTGTALPGDCEDDPLVTYESEDLGYVYGADINPGEDEHWYDGLDQDCDGMDDYDQDDDGFYCDNTILDPSDLSAYCDYSEYVETYPWNKPELDGLHTTGDRDAGDCWDDPGVTTVGHEAADINPDATDTWYDGLDQDCDRADDFDQDLDGYYKEDESYDETLYTRDGTDPSTGLAEAGDCQDDPTYSFGSIDADEIHPTATETWYDGLDQDCASDDDYDADVDGYVPDGYLDSTIVRGDDTLTSADVGRIGDGDCEDDPTYVHPGSGIAAADTHPGAGDTWYDGLDQDCDDRDDFDQDEDGYVPFVYDGRDTHPLDGSGGLPIDDCDDTDDTVYDGAPDEWYDGVDNDCAGNDDYDQDYDGYYAAHVDDYDETLYAEGIGEMPGGDCQDDPSYSYGSIDGADINPGATEAWYDGLDQDCGRDDDYDADADGYVQDGDLGETTLSGETVLTGDDVGRIDDGDCEDDPTYVHPESGIAAAQTNPGEGDEWYDGLDQDCDDRDDFDQDEDGYVPFVYDGRDTHPLDGSGGLPIDDCDDTDDTVYDGAPDEWYDGVDNDCAGNDDYDQDGDGYYAEGEAYVETLYADGTGELDGGDCQDDPSYRYGSIVGADINPGAIDTWYDGLDQDCEADDDYDADGDRYVPNGYESSPVVRGDDTLTGGELGRLGDNDCEDDPDFDHSTGILAEEINPSESDTWYDGVDQDCGGNDDYDQDGDSHVPNIYVGFITHPVDGSGELDGNDCNDTDNDIYDGAPETCHDGTDSDCDDTENDRNAAGCTWFNKNEDGDDFGISTSRCYCDATGVWNQDDALDCDDDDEDVHPDATEVCDGIDNDCDGSTDDPGSADALTWYRDADVDGYGDSDTTTLACFSAPSGYVADLTDCNDGSAVTFPGAAEHDSPSSACMKDADADGYGDDSPPAGVVAGSDCNDGDGTINEDATEVCDGADVDEDCDGQSDDDDVGGATGKVVAYHDGDGDTYGDPGDSAFFCDRPSDHVTNNDDCNDASSAIRPGATELCDGVDNNCDDEIDEDSAADALTWYRDADLDFYGDPGTTTEACELPSGYRADNTDCDDSRDDVHPGASEVCDASDVDEDCDGDADDEDGGGASGKTTFYADGDDDGYGDSSETTLLCDVQDGYTENDDDCDDDAVAVNPAADELCDGIDNDCNGETDEDDAVDAEVWYADDDFDGFGSPSDTTLACEEPIGFSDDNTDCDDVSLRAAFTYPGAAYNEDSLCRQDFDGDGYGSDDVSGTIEPGADCDDDDNGIAPDVTDDSVGGKAGVDNDCDEYIDEDDIYDLLATDPSADVVVITEMQINPFSASPSTELRNEWFELYNASLLTVYLDGWHFVRYRYDGTTGTSVSTTGFTISPGPGLSMEPGERLLMCAKNHTDITDFADCDYFYAQGGAYGTESQCQDVGDSSGDVVNTNFKLTNISATSDRPFELWLGLYDDDCTDSGATFITLDTVDSDEIDHSVEGAAVQLSTDLVDAGSAATDNDIGANWCMNDLDVYAAPTEGDQAGTPGSENQDCDDL